METKKILILSAPLGSGHYMAAKSLKEAFEKKYPEMEVKIVDVFDFTFKLFKETVSWSFVYINHKIPLLYKWLYSHCNEYFQQKILNNLSYSIIHKKKFISFVNEFKPNFILSTNPLPMHLISLTKQQHIIDIPSANVCTDFGFHSLWHNADVNYYFVATEQVKKSLIDVGVNSDKIQITGIPISLKQEKNFDEGKTLNALGFDKNRPVLLIVGGKMKYSKLLKIIKGLKKKNEFFQFIIAAGRDKILYDKLKNSELKKYPSTKIFGFADNLEEFMAVSDLIITKAGGLTVAECMAKGLPMIVNDFIPGQEEDNVNFLNRKGAGIRADSVKDAVFAVINILSDEGKLEKMKKNCLSIAKPDAAADIVDFVVSKI